MCCPAKVREMVAGASGWVIIQASSAAEVSRSPGVSDEEDEEDMVQVYSYFPKVLRGLKGFGGMGKPSPLLSNLVFIPFRSW